MNKKSRQVDKKLSFQVRIDKGWWKLLSQLKTDTKKGFKELVEDALVNTYSIGENGKPESYNTKNNIEVKDNLDLTRN